MENSVRILISVTSAGAVLIVGPTVEEPARALAAMAIQRQDSGQ